MASLAEVKADLIYWTARHVFERVTPSIKLQVKDDATVERAQARTDFAEGANLWFSIGLRATDPDEKIRATIELSQDLINLGRFRQAREFLDQAFNLTAMGTVPDMRTRLYLYARNNEKLGWIADYQGGYTESIHRFNLVRRTMENFPKTERNQDEESLYSTATHFLGRGHFGLATQGINRDENARKAVVFFNEDLRRCVGLREQRNSVPANEGFQYAWLARCYFILGDLAEASRQIDLAGELFKEHRQAHRESGIMAHYYLLRGALRLRDGSAPYRARNNFTEALTIRETVEHYPKGYADAALGIAASYLQEWNLVASLAYVARAIRVYPLAILDGLLGK